MPTTRPGRPDVDVRSALLDAAGELLAREGPAALTTRRISAAAGTTTQAIYTRFGGKEGIVRAMYREGYARLAARLRRVPRSDDPLLDLLELGRAYRAAALESPHFYDVMFGRPVPEFTPDEDDLAVARGTHDILAGAVARLADAGLLRPGADADHLARWLWAVVHGLVSLELVGALDLGPRRGVSEVYDGYLAHALAGFLHPAAGGQAR